MRNNNTELGYGVMEKDRGTTETVQALVFEFRVRLGVEGYISTLGLLTSHDN